MKGTTSSTEPERRAYASDLTDYEWTQIESWLRQAPGPGRKRTVNLREIMNAILYLDRKSTRLNSSHDQISYAVFCLKKKKTPTSDVFSYGDHHCHTTKLRTHTLH